MQDAGLFAKAMNEYSYLLINNPDVSFEGITINGNADLPSKIVQDQRMQEHMLLHGIHK